jgi:hypothetical protein
MIMVVIKSAFMTVDFNCYRMFFFGLAAFVYWKGNGSDNLTVYC